MDLVHEDDEFFGVQDDEDVGYSESRFDEDPTNNSLAHIHEFGGMAQRETQSKQEELKKVAFLDAYDEYKESKLQEGFEAGVVETFEIATRIGKILGKATTWQKLQQKATPLEMTNAGNKDLVTDAVRKFFGGTFQNEDSEEPCTEQLHDLEAELETLMQQDAT